MALATVTGIDFLAAEKSALVFDTELTHIRSLVEASITFRKAGFEMEFGKHHVFGTNLKMSNNHLNFEPYRTSIPWEQSLMGAPRYLEPLGGSVLLVFL